MGIPADVRDPTRTGRGRASGMTLSVSPKYGSRMKSNIAPAVVCSVPTALNAFLAGSFCDCS